MSKYSFSNVKNDIMEAVKAQDSFEKCFVVRNVFSRFAIYVVAPTDFAAFESTIREKSPKWVDTIREISEQDEFIYSDLTSTSVALNGSSKVFFSERHVENSNWFIKDQFKLNTPVTSFYSFKGGVGRTTAAVLTALLLAREGKKVLLIDFDVEAPGLASIFANQEDDTEHLLGVKGFIDFWVDYEANKRDLNKISIDDYYFTKTDQILVGNNGGELVVVPAIATNSENALSYIPKLSKANIKYGFGKEYVPDIFLKTLEEKINPDYIFIDTRTGINNVGGLVFNRYAQNIFLFFYGNQQNMFGLESILPELQELDERNVKYYLVNSPVPKNETDKETEVEYYLEKSYELFCANIYDEPFPAPFDETQGHYPINIHYNEQALVLNSYKKLVRLIGNGNEYHSIANIILNSIEDDINAQIDQEHINSNKENLDYIIGIDKGVGTAEFEFQTKENLKRYFYPRKDYKYIFDKNKFLILGGKGVGKTALFSVLSHPNYANALAEFCGVDSTEVEKIKWVIGLDKVAPFPNRQNFEALKGFPNFALRNYWIILLLRQLDEDLIPNSDLKNEILNGKISVIKHLAQQENIGEELSELLDDINETLKKRDETLIIVYDHLSSILTAENELRGRLVSVLLTFYHDNVYRLSNIRGKIFLREDVFYREVKDITDKVKIQNYTVTIKWEYNQLLNIIWKRIYEQNKGFFIFNGKKFEEDDILGSIPNLSEEKEHTAILERILGIRMGSNNKTYPYNWIWYRTEDTNNQIHPRTLINLFAEGAKLQKEDKEIPKNRIIHSKNMEIALRDTVSKRQVQELSEEYHELKNVFENLSEKVGGRTPIYETDLTRALNELGVEPIDTISKLKDIGLLKDYNRKNKKGTEERRYHIPDIYLFGLNLTRSGTR